MRVIGWLLRRPKPQTWGEYFGVPGYPLPKKAKRRRSEYGLPSSGLTSEQVSQQTALIAACSQ